MSRTRGARHDIIKIKRENIPETMYICNRLYLLMLASLLNQWFVLRSLKISPG